MDLASAVIGAGSSDAVAARHVSEDSACRVLLLEIGPPNRQGLQLMPLARPRVALGNFEAAQKHMRER